jgi:multidrug resistance efflux pump
VKILVDQYAVDSALRVRLSVSANTLESAKQRLRAVQDMVQRLGTGPKEAASLLYRSDIFREQASAELAIAQSSAELDEATQQRQRLADAQKVLEDRLAMFREEYNDGFLTAPVSGIVGAKIADVGETIIPGNPIIEIFDERTRYIEWNIPPNRLIDPVLGSLVFINDGATVSEGRVTEVLMLSGNFAGTKGSVFSPTEYGQVARVITTNPKAMQNLNTRVNVRMNYLSYMNFIARYVGWI